MTLFQNGLQVTEAKLFIYNYLPPSIIHTIITFKQKEVPIKPYQSPHLNIPDQITFPQSNQYNY